MSNGKYPVKKTGSADNERLQINKALDRILDTLSRADQWDEAASWGDHAAENYATAFTELEQFADFGIPSTPSLTKTRETTENGSEVHSITAAWSRAGDDSIVYDLEIREADPSENIDLNSSSDIIDKSDLYGVPIISNDSQDVNIQYKSLFDSDTRYFFRVRIRRNTLVSGWSSFSNIVTSKDAAAPDIPTNLTATPIPGGVRLNWDYNYDSNFNAAKIEILRKPSTSSTFVVVDEVPRPSLSYIDEPLDPEQDFNYKIRSVSFFGNASDLTGEVTASADRANVVIRSNTAPSTRPNGSALQAGDRWIDTDDGERPYVYVPGAPNGGWVEEYTAIPGSNLNPGTVASSKFASTLTSDNYFLGTSGWKIERDSGNVEFNDIDARGTVSSFNYSQGSAGWQIDENGTAEFNSVTARGSFTAGVVSPTEDRIELTPSGTYRIWVGSNTKNDSNGVFWVKSDGSAKIDKSTFGIPDGGFSVGVAVGSGTANQTSNTAALSTGLITIVKSITVEASILFGAFVVQDENFFGGPGSAVPLCDPTLGNITGTLALERSTDNINWTLVDAAPFASGGVCYYITDPDPSILDQRQIVNNIDATKTLVNTPPTPGNYYYRVLYSSWSSYFLSAQTNLNDLTIRFIY